jgi:replicative DNA helicase
VTSASHVVQYANIVAHHSQLRRVLTAARRIAEYSQDTNSDLDTILEKSEKELKSAIREQRQLSDRLEFDDLDDWMQIARDSREPEGTIAGLSTGLFKVDKMTQGFVPGELMILSGQTSHGKTQLSNNIMKKAVDLGKKVVFVTMEMTKKEIGERFNLLTNDKNIGKGKILINRHADLKYTDVTQMIKRAKEWGADMVVIDHLHYFSRSVDNATAEVSKIVKEFKGAAVQYELPIILICHVRKMAPKKHPTLEDLRDSSLIAQDADLVLIVWRDEAPGATNPNEVEVVLWKNRNRQKKHRREFVYAEGMVLTEDDKRPDDVKEKQRIAANNARMLGEHDFDEDEDDLSLDLKI